MTLNRRAFGLSLAASPLLALPAFADEKAEAEDILLDWYKLILELVRHTPTYSPPVASRSFAYVGVTAFEAVAAGDASLKSLAGQLNGLTALPKRNAGVTYSEAVVLHAAMANAVDNFFSNTGPTGQRAKKAFEKKYGARAADGVASDVVARSEAFGRAVATHVLDWSSSDGGAVVENMGFPREYTLGEGPSHWVPTSPIKQQQLPLLPAWGKNRKFAMAEGQSCLLPPPPDYSEDKESEFYRQALEVYEIVRELTPEHKTIARFWSDDPMLSPTPPGHWVSIARILLDQQRPGLARSAEVMARLGVATADAFICCWESKFQHDLLRPVTYIKRVIDPKWEPLLITPPFPEYPSGHSTLSGASATVLATMFGDPFAFSDPTHERDNIKARDFPDFWSAAQEAAMSRMYGGIHFRAAAERGLEQGKCVGAFATALKMKA